MVLVEFWTSTYFGLLDRWENDPIPIECEDLYQIVKLGNLPNWETSNVQKNYLLKDYKWYEEYKLEPYNSKDLEFFYKEKN